MFFYVGAAFREKGVKQLRVFRGVAFYGFRCKFVAGHGKNGGSITQPIAVTITAFIFQMPFHLNTRDRLRAELVRVIERLGIRARSPSSNLGKRVKKNFSSVFD